MGRLIRLSEEPVTDIPGVGRWQALNDRLGIRNFGVSATVMDPDDDTDMEHDEADCAHQEVYVVVQGRARFTAGGEQFEAAPGDIVALDDPAETRNYVALEPGTRIVCFGAGPGAHEHPYGAWIGEEAAARS